MIIKEYQSSSKAELAKSYDHRYAQLGSFREQDAFYFWVLKKLTLSPGSRLLDVACGEGNLLKHARIRGSRVFGVDFSPRAAFLAAQNVGSEVITQAEGEALPFANECFDYVTNLGGLEHFSDPMQGIREVWRVLRPAGKAVFFLPNSYYLADIVWHVWRTGYGLNHGQPLERFATCREWWDLLETGKLKVTKVYRYNFRFPASKLDWLMYCRKPRRLLYLLAAPLIPFHLSYSFLYICTRDEAADRN